MASRAGTPAPKSAGTRESLRLQLGAERYVAIRAVNAAGNVGLPAVAAVSHR